MRLEALEGFANQMKWMLVVATIGTICIFATLVFGTHKKKAFENENKPDA